MLKHQKIVMFFVVKKRPTSPAYFIHLILVIINLIFMIIYV